MLLLVSLVDDDGDEDEGCGGDAAHQRIIMCISFVPPSSQQWIELMEDEDQQH